MHDAGNRLFISKLYYILGRLKTRAALLLSWRSGREMFDKSDLSLTDSEKSTIWYVRECYECWQHATLATIHRRPRPSSEATTQERSRKPEASKAFSALCLLPESWGPIHFLTNGAIYCVHMFCIRCMQENNATMHNWYTWKSVWTLKQCHKHYISR